MRTLALLLLCAVSLHANPSVIVAGNTASSIEGLSVDGLDYDVRFVFGAYPMAELIGDGLLARDASLAINALFSQSHVQKVTDGLVALSWYAMPGFVNATGFPIEINGAGFYGWTNDHESYRPQHDGPMMWGILERTPRPLEFRSVGVIATPEPSSLLLLAGAVIVAGLVAAITAIGKAVVGTGSRNMGD